MSGLSDSIRNNNICDQFRGVVSVPIFDFLHSSKTLRPSIHCAIVHEITTSLPMTSTPKAKKPNKIHCEIVDISAFIMTSNIGVFDFIPHLEDMSKGPQLYDMFLVVLREFRISRVKYYKNVYIYSDENARKAAEHTKTSIKCIT